MLNNNIFRLDILVNNALGMSVLQGAQHPNDDIKRSIERKGFGAVKAFVQRIPLNILHDEVELRRF